MTGSRDVEMDFEVRDEILGLRSYLLSQEKKREIKKKLVTFSCDGGGFFFFHFSLPTFKYQLHSPAFNYLQDLNEFHRAKVARLLIRRCFSNFYWRHCDRSGQNKQENTKDASEAATVSVTVLPW